MIYTCGNTGIPHLALLTGSRKQSTKWNSTNWVTQKGKRSETKISNIIQHYRGFRQECYSETALSEARYSGGYLYEYYVAPLYMFLW
jgi:hypothetical protein